MTSPVPTTLNEEHQEIYVKFMPLQRRDNQSLV